MACVPECVSCAVAAEEVLQTPELQRKNRGALLQKQLCRLSSCSCSPWHVPGWLRLCAGVMLGLQMLLGGIQDSRRSSQMHLEIQTP